MALDPRPPFKAEYNYVKMLGAAGGVGYGTIGHMNSPDLADMAVKALNAGWTDAENDRDDTHTLVPAVQELLAAGLLSESVKSLLISRLLVFSDALFYLAGAVTAANRELADKVEKALTAPDAEPRPSEQQETPSHPRRTVD